VRGLVPRRRCLAGLQLHLGWPRRVLLSLARV
jgi:hypothetical protein